MSKLVRPSIPRCSKSLRQLRTVSSSRSSAAATSRQLHPSSNNTSALARRVTREAANPSRANSISFARSSSPRKLPPIIPLSESVQPQNARKFGRILNESGYTADEGIKLKPLREYERQSTDQAGIIAQVRRFFEMEMTTPKAQQTVYFDALIIID